LQYETAIREPTAGYFTIENLEGQITQLEKINEFYSDGNEGTRT
jgi:hypothetical protein